MKTIWALKLFFRKKFELVLFYRSIVNYSSCCSYTKIVWITKVFELYTTLGYWRWNNLHVIITKFEKISSFAIRGLKMHFPNIKNIVTFIHSAEISRWFIWKDRDEVKTFGFFINNGVWTLVTMARIVPKFNGIVSIFLEEFP